MNVSSRIAVRTSAHQSAHVSGGRARRAALSAESKFFTGYMLCILTVIFVGFAPSYYLRGIAPAAAPLAPLRPDTVIHGALASLFMLAFPFQAWLAARRRFKAHIRVGNWAFLIGALLVPLGYLVGARAYHAARPVPIPSELAEAFMVFPLFGSLSMGLTLWLAWRTRCDGATHKRMMVALACQMADPAIFRLPIFEMNPSGLVATQILMLSTLIPLLLWDVGKLGRIQRGTIIGSTIFVGDIVLRTIVMPTATWTDIVHALPMYGLP